MIFSLAIFMNFAFASSLMYDHTDTTYLLKTKPVKNTFKNGLHLVLPPLKPAYISTTKVSVYKPDDKLLSNVQVFPNPVTDQINLKFEISHNTNVTVKILDVLGNDIITIYNQRVEPGERLCNYNINGKLSRGFYFVRIVAGTESVIKRISVL